MGETTALSEQTVAERSVGVNLEPVAGEPTSHDAAAEHVIEQAEEHSLEQQLEALLLIADVPQSAAALAVATGLPVRSVRDAITRLISDYNGESGGPRRGFELREVAGGYRFYVRESLDPLIRSVVAERSTQRLSQAALETLAVVAYRQPLTRGAIAAIRAVNVDSVVRTLLSRDLITEVDQDPETGAARYGTTDALLQYLGIQSLEQLPPISPFLEDHTAGFEE